MPPHVCWSPLNGHTTEGTPARTAAAVVPDPPWWTATGHRGSTALWSTERTVRLRSSRLSTASRKPAGTSARTPGARHIAATSDSSAAGSGTGMLPNPTYTGAEPPSDQDSTTESGAGVAKSSDPANGRPVPHSAATPGTGAGS